MLGNNDDDIHFLHIKIDDASWLHGTMLIGMPIVYCFAYKGDIDFDNPNTLVRMMAPMICDEDGEIDEAKITNEGLLDLIRMVIHENS